jgi:hypothetical protein
VNPVWISGFRGSRLPAAGVGHGAGADQRAGGAVEPDGDAAAGGVGGHAQVQRGNARAEIHADVGDIVSVDYVTSVP